MFFWTKQQREIKQLQNTVKELLDQIHELQNRTYMGYGMDPSVLFLRHYGPELHINDAVHALAKHLNVTLEPVGETTVPRSVRVVPNKPKKEKGNA